MSESGSSRVPELSLDRMGGIVLILATILALAWANSPWASGYQSLRAFTFGPSFEPALEMSLTGWLNNGLMAVFFLMVGLEIKRAFVEGVLAHPAKAGLTLAAALGGMVLPVAIYLLINKGGPAMHGWGIPMATDIAFAVGLTSLIGGGGLVALKSLLVAIAVIDDLGAVLVIAIFYGHDIHVGYLAAAAAVFAAALVYGLRRRSHPVAIAVLGIVLWYLVLKSGLHATVAGVLLALTIPVRSKLSAHPDSIDLEDALKPWVLLGVMPLFALLNAGVALRGDVSMISPVSIGIAAGLVVGKPLGIVGASWLCIKSGLGRLPEGVTWPGLIGLGMIAGLGFTMSLFIAQLAFDEGSELTQSKMAILLASMIAAVIGLAMLKLIARSAGAPAQDENGGRRSGE